MGVWEALERLDTLVDDSDPDLALPQIVHALQTAEAIRQDGHPRWFAWRG
jgi:inositol oxygenase